MHDQSARRPRSLAGAALATLLGMAQFAPAMAQTDVDPDPLLSSLLQQEDLIEGFSSDGPQEGSDFDIDQAAYDEFGGLRTVSQVWTSEEGNAVFDFRMQFPTSEAAAAYLVAAEPTLSEAEAMGLDPFLEFESVGEHGRHFGGVTPLDEDRLILLENFLFHVGPVAAKVFVGGVGLPEGEARRLAEAAAVRMADLPGAADPPPRDAEPPDPDAADDAVEGDAAPADATASLQALVPSELSAGCTPFSTGTPGELAALNCAVEGGTAVYASMADAEAMGDAFAGISAGMPASTEAASCAEGQYLGTYSSDGATPLGLVACWLPPDADLVLFWTDDANIVLGGVLSATTDFAELEAAWRAAQLTSAPS